jgi:hypothetical protein
MTNLVINDLEYSAALDQSARQAVCGGALSGLFNFDALLSSIKNGDANGNVGVVSSGNIFSPTIITNLAFNIPVNTIVQLNLDNIIDTTSIIASSFSGGTDTPV